MKKLKEEAEQIFIATLNALDLKLLVNKKIRLEDDTLYILDEPIHLKAYRDFILIGFGKASLTIAAAVEEMLDERITRSILVSDAPHEYKLRSEVIIAGHPLPDQNSLVGGRRILELVQTAPPDSLMIFIVTGGGSALVEQPIAPGVTLEDLRILNRLLVNSGATIREINAVRKHLSRIKGGRLGYLARKNSSIRIFLSDVNPGDLRSIASNPLLPDGVEIEEFFDVLERYNLAGKLPPSIHEIIQKDEIAELPKGWTYEKESIDLLIADNHDAIRQAAEVARQKGFHVEIDLRFSEGNYKEVSRELIKTLLALKERFPARTVCLVSGGEVSCPVRGDGVGGRNQEFVLYTALELSKLDDFEGCALSCGTDGVDGNSPATGAVADSETIKQARAMGLDPVAFLERNDSYSFFERVGGSVYTGPTGNNVRDLRLLLAS
jgi:glycerate-2-kinase